MKGTSAALAACCGLALSLAGCGYALRGAKARSAPLRVAAPHNATALAEAGGLLGAALRDALSARGLLGPERGGERVVTSELVFVRSSLGSLGGDTSRRLEAQVRVRVEGGDGTSYEDVAGGSEEYLAGIDPLGTEANRRAALRRVLKAMASELVERYEVAQRLGP